MIIIKVNAILRADSLQHLRRDILKQKETGVIVIPSYCNVEVVDDDIEIRVEDASGDSRD